MENILGKAYQDELITIFNDPDGLLRKKSETVVFDIPAAPIGVEKYVREVLENSPKIIALAANQLGVPYRVMAWYTDNVRTKMKSGFNPEVIKESDEKQFALEGCASTPERVMVRRPYWVDVKYQNNKGKYIEERIYSSEARYFQHENDHLNGILITDYKYDH